MQPLLSPWTTQTSDASIFSEPTAILDLSDAMFFFVLAFIWNCFTFVCTNSALIHCLHCSLSVCDSFLWWFSYLSFKVISYPGIPSCVKAQLLMLLLIPEICRLQKGRLHVYGQYIVVYPQTVQWQQLTLRSLVGVQCRHKLWHTHQLVGFLICNYNFLCFKSAMSCFLVDYYYHRCWIPIL